MDTYKQSGKKERHYLAFYKFYYYLITKSSKKYTMVDASTPNQFWVMFTPFLFYLASMFFHMIYGGITGNNWQYFPFAFFAIFLIINLMITREVASQGYRIQRKLHEEKMDILREQERMERQERYRREQQEFDEYIRQRREEWERERQAQRERDQREQQRRNRQRAQTKTGNPTTDKILASYKILGITPTRDPELIRKAYRAKAKEHHPDRGGDPDRFMTIKEAYDFLIKVTKVTSGGA